MFLATWSWSMDWVLPSVPPLMKRRSLPLGTSWFMCNHMSKCVLLFSIHHLSLVPNILFFFLEDLSWSSTSGTRLQQTSARSLSPMKTLPRYFWSQLLTLNVSEVIIYLFGFTFSLIIVSCFSLLNILKTFSSFKLAANFTLYHF